MSAGDSESLRHDVSWATAVSIVEVFEELLREEEKREACCYALQDKFWLSDPDGNRFAVAV